MASTARRAVAASSFEALVVGVRSLGLRLTEEQLEGFRRYLAGLEQWNSRANLTSSSALADAGRVLFLDSLTLVPVIQREQPGASRLIDVGSGAGFPGLVLKIVMPELRVVLLEATQKKVAFLREMVTALGLEGVEVRGERAEEAGRRGELREAFDVATARALGPLPVVLELALPFCRVGGILIAPRGKDAMDEAALSASVAKALGARISGAERVTAEGRRDQTALVIVSKLHPTPERFPRRTGVPAKRPLQ